MKILSSDEKFLFKRTLSYIKPVKKYLVWLYIVTILTTILELLPTFYMGKIIDSIVMKNYTEVINIIFILFLIFVFNSALSFVETYLNNLLKNKMSLSIKNDFFVKIVRLPTEKFDQIKIGEFISRIEDDTTIISKFYTEDLLNIVLSIATVIVTGYFVLRLSIGLSLIAVFSFPITFLIYYLFGRKIKHYSQEGKKIRDNYYSFLQEALISIREIKCLTIEKLVLNRFNNYSDQTFANNMKITIASTFSGLLNISVTTITDWVIIAYGAWLIISDKLSIGSYIAFNGYISKFLNSIQNIIAANILIQTTAVSLERVYYLLDAEIEQYNDEAVFNILQGSIEINDLQFKYNNSSCETIKNVSLNIKPNTISAIVGLNGCGKSTLLNLIVRLYEHKNGKIIIDGKPIEEISLRSLRENIAYIRQEPYLFNASIKENLLLSKPMATMEEIQDACKKAYIDKYIDMLPDKYETLIGEGGIKLSGGQKQRLSVARAVLRGSKIFLLDEITSDLDGESEYFIMKSIHELSKDHTILMVAHRLSSFIDFPKIYVMNEGVIDDEGTHTELISSSDIYKRLFKKKGHKKFRYI
ncbi:MAG TPA: ABC transporter ATP-binding protein [Clostridiales bacterium]|jgi:ATP-binding cassette subfamily B protein|nr:ABC transporter ATP-binding protein [Clostridiales bacterium]